MAAISKRIRRIDPGDKWRSILSRAHRTVLALVGSYFLANGFIALASAGLPHLGMARTEAVYLSLLTGLGIYVAAAIWVAATHYPARMTGAVILLSVAFRQAAPLIAAHGA